MPGVFEYRATTSNAASTCGNNLANATYGDIDPRPNNLDLGVTFVSGPPAGPSTSGIRAVYYLFSPQPACVGVALHPLTDVTGQAVPPALSWYNLSFSQNLGAPQIPGQIRNLPDINWHQFWFSQDQSLLLLVTKLPVAGADTGDADAGTGVQAVSLRRRYGTGDRQHGTHSALGREHRRSDCRRLSRGTDGAGDRVIATYRNRENQPASCTFAVDRSDCRTGAPQNCQVSTRD